MNEYTTWKQDDPLCGGCGKHCPEESLTWMPTWDFHACPPCVVLCNQEEPNQLDVVERKPVVSDIRLKEVA